MEIYKVGRITEADYGCEETGRKGPMALLKLVSESDLSVEKHVEVPEDVLSAKGISEGKRVCFTKSGEILKYIRVVAAVICDSIENKGKIYATARGYGDLKGGWEFPGGKIEEGETPQEAVVREIHEELEAKVRVGDLLTTIEYDYPTFHLSMDCFWCEIESGELKLLEAEAACWLTKEELDSVNWLPADITIIDKIRECMN